ncbi:MAG: hypothetical protein IPK53_03240 [bacterium]|nr:hypothetical protein [bacterium]
MAKQLWPTRSRAIVPAARQRLADAESRPDACPAAIQAIPPPSLNGVRSREAILDNLDTHFANAVHARFPAGLDAARQNSLER